MSFIVRATSFKKLNPFSIDSTTPVMDDSRLVTSVSWLTTAVDEKSVYCCHATAGSMNSCVLAVSKLVSCELQVLASWGAPVGGGVDTETGAHKYRERILMPRVV